MLRFGNLIRAPQHYGLYSFPRFDLNRQPHVYEDLDLGPDAPCELYDFKQDAPLFWVLALLFEDFEMKVQRAAHGGLTGRRG